MRPYFSIIVDSFRAAFASRVLYALLAIIILLLLALAPLHLREGLEWKLSVNKHLTAANGPEVVAHLIKYKDSDSHPEVKQIWDRLDEETQKRFEKQNSKESKDQDKNKPKEEAGESENATDVSEPRERRGPPPSFRYALLAESLNQIVLGDSLYDETVWGEKDLDEETRELIETRDSLGTEQQRRLNRLLINEALPAIRPPEPSSQTVYYLWFELVALTTNQEFFALALTSTVTLILDKFVMSLGLMIGILVTANIIPETFDPGSLNLLLSKPISRAGLFITKFFGGCVLIAICSVLLFCGLWLWLGLAADIWESALLWSIPIYILVFAIYFSISSFIGLVFRSPIMAIVMTVVFWGVCWSLGFGYQRLNAAAENNRLYNVAALDETIVAQDGLGELVQWSPDKSSWEKVAKVKESDNPGEAIGMGIAYWTGRLKSEPFLLTPKFDGQGNAYVGTAPLQELGFSLRQEFVVSTNEKKTFRQFGQYPRDSMASFGTPDGLLVVDRRGKFLKLDASVLEQKLTAPIAKKPQDAGPATAKKLSTKVDLGFVEIGPKNAIRVNQTYAVAYNDSNHEIAIHEFKSGENRIYIFKRVDGKYQQDRSVQFDLGTSEPVKCFVEYQGNHIVVVAGNGQVISFAADSLKELNGYRPETQYPIETLAGSPDGRWFALMYGDGRLWMLDTEDDDKIQLASVTGQGWVSSVSFDKESRMWVVDRQDRAILYDPETMSPEKTCSASEGVFEVLYRYAVRPLYTIFPKPSEFYKVVQHLSSSLDAEGNESVDLIGIQAEPDPLSPLYSGLGFMVLMLFISCTIFHFKDY